MRNFRELEVWKEAMDIVKLTYAVAGELPDSEKFGLRSQMTRAAVSIASNIAEGCAKMSEKEFKMYLEISMGSLFELETQLLIVKELRLISRNLDELIVKIHAEQRMLNAFISKVKARTKTQYLKPNT